MGVLADTLISKGGYGSQDAINAENGPRAAELAKEFGVQGFGNSANTSGNPQVDVNKAIEDAFNKLKTDLVTNYTAYKSSHPFNLDEVFAQKVKEAGEQIDPYYNETLSNYITGVTRKISRSKEDSQQVLDTINADTSSYNRNTKLKLDEAVMKSEQGYDDAGLFTSGARYRDSGLLDTAAANTSEDFVRGQNLKTTQNAQGLDRTITDVNSAANQDIRNINRQQYTDTQTRAGQLTKESGQQYVQGFNATLPPELQAANGFDSLKSLGIYS